MAQVSMTVRMDSKLKQQFNDLCNEIGMSVNTAINVFANAAVRTRGIPFEIKATPKTEAMTGLEAFQQIRKMAESGQLPDLTLEEIDEEIRLASTSPSPQL
jgi:addiction module RelB/DinJ family antitoxin